MTRIDCDLDLRYLPASNGHVWQLIDDFRVDTDTAGLIEVPAGFQTDFNSTPEALWNLLPPTEYGEAATLHDWLYRTGMVRGTPITRDVADRVHRELVQFRHAPAWKVWAYWSGLRLGGWVVWNRYRKAEQAGV